MPAPPLPSAERDAIIAAAKARFGHIDILVNNVGIGGGDAPAHKIDETAFDRIVNVNLKGTMLMMNAPPAVAQRPAPAANWASCRGIDSPSIVRTVASAAPSFSIAGRSNPATIFPPPR